MELPKLRLARSPSTVKALPVESTKRRGQGRPDRYFSTDLLLLRSLNWAFKSYPLKRDLTGTPYIQGRPGPCVWVLPTGDISRIDIVERRGQRGDSRFSNTSVSKWSYAVGRATL